MVRIRAYKIFMLTVLMLFTLTSKSDTIKVINRDTTRNLTISPQKMQCFNDTIIHKGVLIIHSENSENEDSMPWIVALIIGILSVVVNILIAYIQNKANQSSIDKQLNAARQTINDQIKSTKEIAILEFNRSVKSHNRQEWINTLRNLISEIDTKILHIALDPKQKNTENIMAITFLSNKIELMLNTSEPEHKTLLASIKTLMAEVTNPMDKISGKRHGELRELYFNATKAMLKMEWERVKKGE